LVDCPEKGGKEMNLFDHVASSVTIEPDDLEFAPFRQRGGLGKAHQLFGNDLPKLLDELNTVLAA